MGYDIPSGLSYKMDDFAQLIRNTLASAPRLPPPAVRVGTALGRDGTQATRAGRAMMRGSASPAHCAHAQSRQP